jgi:hypothetical protein
MLISAESFKEAKMELGKNMKKENVSAIAVLDPKLLYFQRARQGGEDKICWIPSKRKSFAVKSYYHLLSTPVSSTFPWKSIWKVETLSQVAFFVWMLTIGKILTLDNLQMMNVIVVNWCCMCKKNVEFIDYLLLHYEVAKELLLFIIYYFIF